MVITSKVQSQFFENHQQVIRIEQDDSRASVPTKRSGTPWTRDEHERFLRALEKYPSGPWKLIAWSVGTRTTRQTMTHAQKYREKIARRRRLEEQAEALSRCSSFIVSPDAAGATEAAMTAVTTATSPDADVPAAAPSVSASIPLSGPLSASSAAAAAASSSMSGGGGHCADTYNFHDNDFYDNSYCHYESESDERVLDASIALLLESYEPLEIGADDPFWEELRVFSDELGAYE